ncbi:P-loop containing nucleoside triphosphate hydrolase protein [Sporodiniella umbellata]|nr:P-loop containing nucleoside triphosphate hydrolase protein [Sporodiniella umbellata]
MRLLILQQSRSLLRPMLARKRLYHSTEYHGSDRVGLESLGHSTQDTGTPLSHSECTPVTHPRAIVDHLNEYVIGQDRAKKTLAVAIFNHYNRVRANRNRMAATEQDHLQTEYHLSSMTEDSYFSHPALTGSQRRAWLNPPTEGHGPEGGKLLHDETKPKPAVELVDDTVHDKSNVLLVGPTGSGKTLLARTLAQVLKVPFSMSDATPFTQAGYVGEDVESVIQRLLQACDFDVRRAESGIVFIDEIDKISRRSDAQTASRDVSGEGVQQSLLRILEGTTVNITDKSGPNPPKRGAAAGNGGTQKGETYTVDTSNILFILSGAFIGLDRVIGDRMAKGSIGFDAYLKSEKGQETDDLLGAVEPADLIKYGFIPEFVGRIPVVTSVNNLAVADLVRVLKEPKNSLLKQYEALFKLNNVQLRFSQNALKAVAALALEKKTGARGLRRIMENLLLEPMYDTPGSQIKQVVVDSKVVYRQKRPVYITSENSSLADKIVSEDDDTHSVEDDTQKRMTQI